MPEAEERVVTVEAGSMKTSTLRQLWAVVEETQTSTLLKFTDAELVQQLLRQLNNEIWLSNEEKKTISTYLNSKVSLIRDMAHARLA